MNIEAIRLGAGEDLRENLEGVVRQREFAAAFILGAVGSLRRIRGTVLGGHLLPGCIVRTTAELVIGNSDAHRFSRALDPATGFRELVIERAPGPR